MDDGAGGGRVRLMYCVRKRYPGKRKVGGTMDTVISALLILFCVVYVAWAPWRWWP